MLNSHITIFLSENLIPFMSLPLDTTEYFWLVDISRPLCLYMLCCSWSRSVLQCRYIALLCDTHAMQLQCTPALTEEAVHLLAPPSPELQRRRRFAAVSVLKCCYIQGSHFSAFIYLFTCIFPTTTFPSAERHIVLTQTCTV